MRRTAWTLILLLTAACETQVSHPEYPKTLAELGVEPPIDTPAKLVKVMRAGRISVSAFQKAAGIDNVLNLEATNGAAPGNSAPIQRLFNADGVLAVLQKDPAGSSSPAVHFIAVTDAQKFAESFFAGNETLRVRRAADFRSPTVATLRMLSVPGALPYPGGGYLSTHSDYKDVDPIEWQHAASITEMEPAGNDPGYEMLVYLGKWNIAYADQRITASIQTQQAQLRARFPNDLEDDPGWRPQQEVAVQSHINFDAFALDESLIQFPAPPQNYGLNLLAHVPINTYPSGAHVPTAQGNVVAFGTGFRIAGETGDIAYVVDVSDIGNPKVTVVNGNAAPGDNVALQLPYLYLPDEGPAAWVGGAPPYDNYFAGASLREIGGMQIFDVSQPNPPQVGFFRFTGQGTGATNVAVQDGWAYLFSGALFNAVQVVDVTNPAVPTQRDFFASPNSYGSVISPVNGSLRGKNLYIAWRDEGIRAYDVSNPQKAALLWAMHSIQGPMSSVTVTPNNLMLTTEESIGGPLRIFDVSNANQTPLSVGRDQPIPTTAFKQLSSWSAGPASRIHVAAVDGNKVYVAAFTDGLYVLDISDPTKPKEVGRWLPRAKDGFTKVTDYARYLGEGVSGVAIGDQYVFVTDTEEGLFVFQR